MEFDRILSESTESESFLWLFAQDIFDLMYNPASHICRHFLFAVGPAGCNLRQFVIGQSEIMKPVSVQRPAADEMVVVDDEDEHFKLNNYH